MSAHAIPKQGLDLPYSLGLMRDGSVDDMFSGVTSSAREAKGNAMWSLHAVCDPKTFEASKLETLLGYHAERVCLCLSTWWSTKVSSGPKFGVLLDHICTVDGGSCSNPTDIMDLMLGCGGCFLRACVDS